MTQNNIAKKPPPPNNRFKTPLNTGSIAETMLFPIYLVGKKIRLENTERWGECEGMGDSVHCLHDCDLETGFAFQ